MHEQSSAYETVSFEKQPFHPKFDRMKFLSFSGWTLLSLCLWAGLIETVRLLF